MVNFLTTFVSFLAYINTRSPDTVKIDNSAFCLHYDYTTAIMFLSTALLGLSDFWGKSISSKPKDVCCGLTCCWVGEEHKTQNHA